MTFPEEVTHQTEEVIASHWFLCVCSARLSWFDPVVHLPQQQQQQQLHMRQSNRLNQALTASKNNIGYCTACVCDEMSNARQSGQDLKGGGEEADRLNRNNGVTVMSFLKKPLMRTEIQVH